MSGVVSSEIPLTGSKREASHLRYLVTAVRTSSARASAIGGVIACATGPTACPSTGAPGGAPPRPGGGAALADELRLALAFALGFGAALVTVPLAIRLAWRTGFLDHPVGYKKHAGPTP